MKNKYCFYCGCDSRFLQKNSRLGCSFCYSTFATEMKLVLPNLQQGKLLHVGKVPNNYENPTAYVLEKIVKDSNASENEKDFLLKNINKN